MSLRRRLSRLESAHIFREGCPECGLRPSEIVTDYEVIWHDSEEDEPAEEEFCGTCGRQTTWVVGWEDLDLEDRDRGEGVR